MVKEGVQWRIGDDNLINLWTQPWLNNSSNLYVSSTHSNVNSDLKVRGLIDYNSCAWKKILVEEIFNPTDAEHILSIPLLKTMEHDKLIWRFTQNEEYSVKSAYHNTVENMLETQLEE